MWVNYIIPIQKWWSDLGRRVEGRLYAIVPLPIRSTGIEKKLKRDIGVMGKKFVFLTKSIFLVQNKNVSNTI